MDPRYKKQAVDYSDKRSNLTRHCEHFSRTQARYEPSDILVSNTPRFFNRIFSRDYLPDPPKEIRPISDDVYDHLNGPPKSTKYSHDPKYNSQRTTINKTKVSKKDTETLKKPLDKVKKSKTKQFVINYERGSQSQIKKLSSTTPITPKEISSRQALALFLQSKGEIKEWNDQKESPMPPPDDYHGPPIRAKSPVQVEKKKLRNKNTQANTLRSQRIRRIRELDEEWDEMQADKEREYEEKRYKINKRLTPALLELDRLEEVDRSGIEIRKLLQRESNIRASAEIKEIVEDIHDYVPPMIVRDALDNEDQCEINRKAKARKSLKEHKEKEIITQRGTKKTEFYEMWHII